MSSGFNAIGNGMKIIPGSDDLERDYADAMSYAMNYDNWNIAKGNCNEEHGLAPVHTLTGHLTDLDMESEPLVTNPMFNGICFQKCPTGYTKKWSETTPTGAARKGYWTCQPDKALIDVIADQIVVTEVPEGAIVLTQDELDKLPYNLQAIGKKDPAFLNGNYEYLMQAKEALGDDFKIYYDYQQKNYDDEQDILMKRRIYDITPYKLFTNLGRGNLDIPYNMQKYGTTIAFKRGEPPYDSDFQFDGWPTEAEVAAYLVHLKDLKIDWDAKFAYDTYNAYISLVNTPNEVNKDFDTLDYVILGALLIPLILSG